MFVHRLRSWLLTFVMMAIPALSSGQIGILVTIAPPALPVYEQPLCPEDGYLWAPGYWAYDADDYYWVPGTWVMPPEAGLLWTPGYWAWNGGGFAFYEGYWAPQVGFYGGINYGFGYFGHGYEGGRWDRDHFFYNRAVNNVSVTNIRNVYNTTVVNNTTVTRVSYNGGNGGINERPRPEEEAVARGRRIPPVAAQAEHLQAARSNPDQRVAANHGRPPAAATPRPGALRDREVVRAREAGAPSVARDRNAVSDSNGSRPAVHPNDVPRGGRMDPPNTGDPGADRKFQQQQEKMQAKQDRELQKLQQKQDADHKKMAQRHADDARMQQLEQKHQQQTQKLQQRNEQQQQRIQQRMPAPKRNHQGPGGNER